MPPAGLPERPKNGYQKRFRFQARLVWQWWNHLESHIRAKGKRLLNVNLDETSVPIMQTSTKGNVVPPRHSEAAGVRPVVATNRECARKLHTRGHDMR